MYFISKWFVLWSDPINGFDMEEREHRHWGFCGSLHANMAAEFSLQKLSSLLVQINRYCCKCRACTIFPPTCWTRDLKFSEIKFLLIKTKIEHPVSQSVSVMMG